MHNLILKIHQILNLAKGFEVGYKSPGDGKLLIDYCGERFFVKIEKVENPSASAWDDLDRLDYFN